jgi:predicted nucleic acid-binding protein
MQEEHNDHGEMWLQRTTTTLLETTPGSLVKGKWHELVSMMTAWSRRLDEDQSAPLVLEQLLKRVIDEQRAGNRECSPTTDLYNYVIDAWAAATSEHGRAASRRARQILHLLQRTHDVEQDPERRPNAHSFLTVLKAAAKTEKAPVARETLRWMEQLYSSGRNPDAKPTMSAYVAVLDAFANSDMEDAGNGAEEVLKQMNATGLVPSTLCYNIAIKAWMKSQRGRQSAEHAERILEEMQSPADVVTYSSVIHTWAISGMNAHAAERAEQILLKIENDKSVVPNIVVYNACLNAWCKSRSPLVVNRTEALLRRMEASTHVTPDLVSYNTYLHALAMMGKEPAMAQRADDTLCRLEERFDTGEIDFSPNVFSYNLVIEGWVRSRDANAATRACDVLRKLVKRDGVEPDAISFNQVLNALSRSSLPGAAQKAENLLHYMDESYKSGVYNCKVDIVGYTSVISAWSRSGQTGGAERAEHILNLMEQRYLAGEDDIKPNIIAYNAVIDGWAKSGEGTMGARRAEALLRRMQDMYEMGDRRMQPNIITYNSLLNAWARSGTRCCAYKAERYLNLMWELYEAGNKRVKPDGKSYNTVRSRSWGAAVKRF